MELKEIKQLLSINQVLGHYGLKPDKNNRLLSMPLQVLSPATVAGQEDKAFVCKRA